MKSQNLAAFVKSYSQIQKAAGFVGDYLTSQRGKLDYLAVGGGILLGGVGIFDNMDLLQDNLSWSAAFPSFLIPAAARFYYEGKKKYEENVGKEGSLVKKLKGSVNAFMTGAIWTPVSLLETTITASLVVHYGSQLIQKL